jgi:imidazolonepropionase-like amidohydrolase
MKRSAALAVVAVALLASIAAAADRPTLIRGARVFDGRKLLEQPSDVLIRGGKIETVAATIDAPADAEIVDANGKTLLPGLIDCHTHILAPPVLRQAAAFGVTTELDMFMMPSLVRELRASADVSRADFHTAVTLATAPGGHGTQFGFAIPTLSKPTDAPAFVDARIAEGADHIKIIYDDGRTAGMKFSKLSRETMAAVVKAAHEKHLIAVVHVMDQDSAREVIEAGADGLAHVFCDAVADDALIKLAKDRHVFVTATLTVMENFGGDDGTPLAKDSNLGPMMSRDDIAALKVRFPRRSGASASVKNAIESVRRLHAAGVPILAGTDVPNPGTVHGVSMHRELEMLVDAGLTPAEALAAATAGPADAFKLADRGRIAAGLRADLILVDGDPTHDIKASGAISKIWLAGQPFDRDAYRRHIEQRNAFAAKLSGPGPLLVSDFEQNDITSTFGLGWSISTDQIQRGKSTASIKLIDDGADGSKRSLQLKGSINPPLPWAWAGTMFSPGSTVMGPADLSGKKTISFWAKGDGKPARIMLFARSTGYQPAFQVFTPTEKWTRNTFEIKSFNNSTGKDITAIIFSGGVEFGPFEYQIDQVMFE